MIGYGQMGEGVGETQLKLGIGTQKPTLYCASFVHVCVFYNKKGMQAIVQECLLTPIPEKRYRTTINGTVINVSFGKQ